MRESVHDCVVGSSAMSTAMRCESLAIPRPPKRQGRACASALAGGMIVTLSGDLGAGKTTPVRGCLRARRLGGLGQESQLSVG